MVLQATAELEAVGLPPEKVDLLSAMLKHLAADRSSMEAGVAHPGLWTDKRKLQFLVLCFDVLNGLVRPPPFQ